MKKTEIIENASLDAGVTKAQAEQVINRFLADVLSLADRGDNLILKGFGTFKGKTRQARPSRNPRTGEEVTVPERNVVTFAMSKTAKG